MDSGTQPSQAGLRRSRQLADRLEPLGRRLRSRVTVDTRSLAALRIALGLTLLIDLIHRAGSIELFYTDNGVYPIAAYEVTYSQFTGLSIHALSGALWFQQLLFVLTAIAAIGFILGYRTRLLGVICLILLFSLQARNPAVLNGGDRLFRVLFFVALVAPLGERWSIDALRRGSARLSVASFGTTALLVQPLAVLSANAYLKHQGDHWYAGEALEIALLNDVMAVYLGNVLVEYSSLLTVLNYIWVVLLSGAVLFLFVPTGRLRALAAVVYIGAFAGMILTISVGLFPLVLIASVLPYLTAPFWDVVARQVPAEWARRVPRVDQLGPLGRPPVERRLLASIRERGYPDVASYIVAYGRSFLTVAGVLVVAWILVFTAADVSERDVPAEIDSPHLDQQRWGLYAPDPSEAYSWYLIEVDTEDNTYIADIGGIAQQFDRPPDASQEYDTFRHRKYMQTVRSSSDDDTGDTIADSYSEWACRELQAQTDSTVESVTVYRLYQSSPVDGELRDPRTLTIIEQHCLAD